MLNPGLRAPQSRSAASRTRICRRMLRRGRHLEQRGLPTAKSRNSGSSRGDCHWQATARRFAASPPALGKVLIKASPPAIPLRRMREYGGTTGLDVLSLPSSSGMSK